MNVAIIAGLVAVALLLDWLKRRKRPRPQPATYLEIHIDEISLR